MANKDSEKAISELQKLNKDSTLITPLPKEVIRWYLALAHLSEDEIPEAKLLFEDLVSPPKASFKQNEAAEILEMLKE